MHPEDGQSGRTARPGDGVPFKIYGEQEFTDAMFPWFEPSTARGTRQMKHPDPPGVSDSTRSVRYIVWLMATPKVGRRRSITCAAGPVWRPA
jgi:hypothetical protein